MVGESVWILDNGISLAALKHTAHLCSVSRNRIKETAVTNINHLSDKLFARQLQHN